ncbi:MAG: hypothetical protein ACP5UO_06090 [Thermoplasmata archaeon]
MIILLADAELELVPPAMLRDKEVQDVLRREGKENVLLDNHVMKESILRHFPERAGRIGFPDIAYMFWRMNRETVLQEKKEIEYAIHTKWNVIIETRDLEGIDPSYMAFKERVEELLSNPRRESPLLGYLRSKGVLENTMVLHPLGQEGIPISSNSNYVIGGFPEGDFISDLGNMKKVSLHREEITVPSVIEILHFRLFSSAAHP